MRALLNRPTYLQRFPDGVEGEEVSRSACRPRCPEHVQSCRVTFPSGRHADALKVTNPADVVWAANLGTVTFHPWHATCSDVEHPDQLRVDLDPQPGTGFRDAAGVAGDVVRPCSRSWATSATRRQRRTRPARLRRDRAASGPSPRSAARPSRSRGRWSAAPAAGSPRRGGRSSAASRCSSTTTRTPATARSPRPTPARRTPTATVSAPLTLGRARRRRARRLHHRHRSGARRPAGRPDGVDREVRHGLEPLLDLAERDEAGRPGRPALPAELPEDAGRAEAGRCPAVPSGHRGHLAAGRAGPAGRRLRPCHPGRSLA